MLGHSQQTFWSATKQWNSWVVQRLTCGSAPTSDTDTPSHLKMKHSLEESRCAVPGVWSFISKFYNVLLLTVNPTEGTTPEVSTDNKKRNSKEEQYCQLFVQWDKIPQFFCYCFEIKRWKGYFLLLFCHWDQNLKWQWFCNFSSFHFL